MFAELLGFPSGEPWTGSNLFASVPNREITMKILILAAIRCSLMFTAVTASLFCVRPAEAYTVTLEQMGSNVVANRSGPINLTGLTSAGQVGVLPGLSGALAIIQTGPDPSQVDRYIGFTGPTSFGLGFF